MQYRTKVLWAEMTEVPLGWYVRKHQHDYYQLFYMLDGQTEFVVDGENLTKTEGDCLIFPPQCLHETVLNTLAPSLCYEVKFTVFDPYIASCITTIEPSIRNTDFVKASLGYIIDHWMHQGEQEKSNVDYFLSAMLIYLTMNCAETKRNASRYIDTSTFDDTTKSIILFIERNYAKPFKLDTLAKELGYSRNYICSVFKKETGITIVNYLNYIKVRRAAELFSYTGGDVGATSARLGFLNISHFSRLFKSYVGVSPSKYRKALPIGLEGNLGTDVETDNIFNNQAASIEEAMMALKMLGRIANQQVD